MWWYSWWSFPATSWTTTPPPTCVWRSPSSSSVSCSSSRGCRSLSWISFSWRIRPRLYRAAKATGRASTTRCSSVNCSTTSTASSIPSSTLGACSTSAPAPSACSAAVAMAAHPSPGTRPRSVALITRRLPWIPWRPCLQCTCNWNSFM